MKKLLLLTVVLFLFTAVNSWGATIYVDAANASGIEDGSQASPFNTIPEGIDAATEGDLVSVAPGIYHGAVDLKNAVKLVSQQGPFVTHIDVMGGSVRMPYTLTANTYIEGFTIYGSGNPVFVSNRVSFWAYSSIEINNCIIKDAGTAVESYPMANVSITRSVIYWSTTAVDAIWSSSPQLKNVTIDFVTTAVNMYQVGAYLYNTNITNTGSVFSTWGYRGSGYVYGSNNNIWRYSALTSPGSSGQYPYVGLSNTLEVDPLYVAMLPHGLDYHLREGSPLIDAGVNVGLPFNGAAPDLGAYETDYANIQSMAEGLAESYQDTPVETYKNAGEQRRHALQNKMRAVIEKLTSITDSMSAEEKIIIYTDSLNKLRNDILAKADGFYGGNPNNDWIVTKEEQDRLYPKVMELITAIEAEIQKIQGA